MTQKIAIEQHRPETLVQSALRHVIGYIRQNNLEVGDKLPSEVTFTKELGVSRTVVREAFKSLAAMHIIDMSAGRRAQVSAFDDTVIALSLTHALRTRQINVQQIWDARRSIEMRTVELAAIRRTNAEAAHIQQLAQLMRDTYQDLPQMTEYDIDFHIAIAEASRNPLFPVLVSSLTDAMRETNPIVWQSRRHNDERIEVIELHTAIADAIAAGNPEAAVKALELHFNVASTGLIRAGFN